MNAAVAALRARFRQLALGAVLAWCAPMAAVAADISIKTTDGFSLIFIVGELESGDHNRFIQIALPVQRGLVVLGSQGGNLQAGIEIGKAIRLKDFATFVPSNVVCASACALAWLGGTRRLMASNAKIGFHAAYRMENGAARETGLGNAIVGAYLNSLGLSQRAVEFISSADPSSMQWLTPANGSQHGIEVGRFDLQSGPSEQRPQAVGQGSSRAVAASSGPTPQFRDFPAAYMHEAPNAAVDLAGPAYNYRTRLRSAALLRPNFGGRFIVATWGCGTSCLTGAVIDAPTGKVTFFPFSICCATPDKPNFKAIEFRAHSRLIIFAGLRNEEQPMGAHFYEFDGTSFRHVRTIEDDGRFAPH